MTRRPTGKQAPSETPGQLDLFGGPAPAAPDQPAAHPASPASETNDMDLVTMIAGNASRGLYVLVGSNERVYVRADGLDSPDLHRVPRYEENAVHQLLGRGWLNAGGRTKDLSCGAATLSGTAVTCPASTRARVHRWNALQSPSTWTTPATTTRPALRVVKGVLA